MLTNRDRLNHLRFADDAVLITEDPEELIQRQKDPKLHES